MDDRVFLSAPEVSGTELEYIEQAISDNWIGPLGPYVEQFESQLREHRRRTSGDWRCPPERRRYTSRSKCSASSAATPSSPHPSRSSAASRPCASSGPNRGSSTRSAKRGTWTRDFSLRRSRTHDRSGARRRRQSWSTSSANLRTTTLFGRSAPQKEIPIIEDAAEALGATYKGQQAGAFGRIGILSFNGNKILTTSTGGALLSDDDDLVDQAFFLATQARDPAAHYEHSQTGFNYRMSSLLAAFGRTPNSRRWKTGWRNDGRSSTATKMQLGSLPGLSFMPEAERMGDPIAGSPRC